MTTIQDKYANILPEVEKIIGNVKGGLKQPTEAAQEIHAIYAEFIEKEIRYPGEPPIYIKQETQEDRILKQHFSQTDKGK